MVTEEQLAIIRRIDNRVRELELLDLVTIGSYNVNLSVFGISDVGRIKVLSDNNGLFMVELLTNDNQRINTIETSLKNIVRSIIDYEFSSDSLRLYDRYLSFRMASSLDRIGQSIDTINGLYSKKKEYKKEISAIDNKLRQYEYLMDYDYCLVGSECLYSSLKKTQEMIRREYIQEGVAAATVNNKVEKLERGLLAKTRHKRKIAKIKEDGKELSMARMDRIEERKDELKDTMVKYKKDLDVRCLRVLANMKVIGMARVSYMELVEGLADKNISDVMRDETITPKVIYDYFVDNIVTYDLMEPDEYYSLFKEYIFGHLYKKKRNLEVGLANLDMEIKKEFDNQTAINIGFIPQYGFSTVDGESYSKLHR